MALKNLSLSERPKGAHNALLDLEGLEAGNLDAFKSNSYVFMIFRPALRFLMRPRPPAVLAARRLAAVIRPPLLFFIVITPFLAGHLEIKLDRQVTRSSVRERTQV
jgi:hypothetical protein